MFASSPPPSTRASAIRYFILYILYTYIYTSCLLFRVFIVEYPNTTRVPPLSPASPPPPPHSHDQCSQAKRHGCPLFQLNITRSILPPMKAWVLGMVLDECTTFICGHIYINILCIFYAVWWSPSTGTQIKSKKLIFMSLDVTNERRW